MAKTAYADAIIYDTPTSLAALKGPSSGTIELPRTIYWGPERTVDLSDRDDLQRMYQALVRTGSTAEQETWLSWDLLISIWNDLVLPVRCAALWEDRFDDLTRLAWH